MTAVIPDRSGGAVRLEHSRKHWDMFVTAVMFDMSGGVVRLVQL